MSRWWWLVPALAVWLSLPLSCHGGSDTAQPSSSASNGIGGGLPDGGGAAGGGGSGADGGGTAIGGGAEIYLGMSANATGPGGELPSPADSSLAEMTVLAAGVRAVFVSPRWDQLDSAGMIALQAQVADYAQRNLHVVLALLPVDGRAAHVPSGLGGSAWQPTEWQTAMDATLDAIVGTMGQQLDALVLGRDVNVYLDTHPAEASGLVYFIGHAMSHLAGLGSPPRGVGLRFDGKDPSPNGAQLAALGEVLAISYLPGIGEPSLPTSVSTAKDLDAMMALAAGRTVALQAVGFASDPALDGSEAGQRQFFEGFFSALLSRAAAFPWVNVRQLQDFTGTSCDALAAAQGLAPTDAAVLYLCSLGLRSTLQQPKEAWPIFVEASASLSGQ